MDVNRNAPVVVELSTVIAAPPAAVWRQHTTVDAWPAWQPDITHAEAAGPPAVGTSFAWHTFGLDIVSTVYEVDPLRRIVWGGPAHGIDGIHLWTFTEEPGADGTGTGTVVRTVESWDGPPITADPDGMRAALTASLTAWLAALKAAAESAG